MVYIIARFVGNLIEIEAQSYGESVWHVQYHVDDSESVCFLQDLESKFKKVTSDVQNKEKFTAFVNELRATLKNKHRIRADSYHMGQVILIDD